MLSLTSGTVTDALTVVVLGVVGYRLVSGLRVAQSHAGRSLALEIVRRIRWRHVLPVPLVLSVVIAVAWQVTRIPGLDWGWWSALGGDGNPVFGSSSTTAGTVWEWLVPLLFMCLLVPALPLFAHAEERMFRAGAEDWSWQRRMAKAVQFGLVHCLIGIPVGVALALSLGGAYFMWVYLRRFRVSSSRRDATIESAAAHTAYNGMIVALVILAVVGEAFGW